MNQQERNKKAWVDLQETLNNGDFEGMDRFFHPDFEYVNPSRPDLTGYEAWKQSPMANYKTFPPCRYSVKDIVAEGDKVWAHCHHYGKHTGGPYMGIAPTGNEVNVEWFSIITFKDEKILRIFSIADVLGMLIQIGAIDKSTLPTNNPNR